MSSCFRTCCDCGVLGAVCSHPAVVPFSPCTNTCCRCCLLSLVRFSSLLARAMASVPLASDADGPLDVVYEDEQLLAVNKPVGLHTAPIHRFTGACGVWLHLDTENRHG